MTSAEDQPWGWDIPRSGGPWLEVSSEVGRGEQHSVQGKAQAAQRIWRWQSSRPFPSSLSAGLHPPPTLPQKESTVGVAAQL